MPSARTAGEEDVEGSGENGSGTAATAAEAGDSGDGDGAAPPNKERARDPLAELYSESEEDEEDEEGGGGGGRFKEVALDLVRQMKRELATPAVVYFVVQQGLRHYASNSVATNAAACAVLTRIAAPEVRAGFRERVRTSLSLSLSLSWAPQASPGSVCPSPLHTYLPSPLCIPPENKLIPPSGRMLAGWAWSRCCTSCRYCECCRPCWLTGPSAPRRACLPSRTC